ncbi:toll/interleukin-1 receptor domain-containing protein [Ferdinandcohnia sp. SAFN-114]|uniref:toll/interleukin-1 receptor domain-containing protein n=1 Tax=Ferdinandcohnia sp. SAFN-114 TaxID=3387275 RepID=UPI003F7FABB5
MGKGINIAENVLINKYASYNSVRKPVVFLSHKSEDKDYVEAIGNYLINAGINIYLDSSDFKLQTAIAKNDPKAITDCIQEGISKSDYILCFASQKTVMSWWVPYEIGYGKRAEKEIATLIRKDVEYIPDFLKIEEILDDISDLNNFIKKVTSEHGIPLMEKYSWEYSSNDYIEKSSNSHTLSKYLNVR